MAQSHYLNNVALWSVWSSDIHLRAFFKEKPYQSISIISLKITYLKFHSSPHDATIGTAWNTQVIITLVIIDFEYIFVDHS